jgi:hypothetical protein
MTSFQVMPLGVLKKVDLKTIWPGEATHFTPWLANNLDHLGEVLDMDLQLESTEVSAGDFSADIVARDLSTNRKVIIENQYGSTDHKHLGQLMTYCAVLDADVVVWIAESIRSEHKAAMDFLNLNLKDSLSLYAVEASAIKVDQSNPAFLLSVVSRPNENRAADTAPQTSEIQEKYRSHFQALIDELRNKHQFTNARTGQPQNWYAFSSENSKIFKYGANFNRNSKVSVEIYIDSGDKAQNEAIFDALQSRQTAIETELGHPLTWERIDNKRACRIAVYRDGDIEADTETLAAIRAWTVDELLAFKRVFPRHIREVLSTLDL